MNHNFKTLADLKSFVNTLSEKELKQPVRFWGEEIGGNISHAEVLGEDYFNPSGDCCEPISNYKDEEDFQELLETEPIVLSKGTIVFNVEQGAGMAKYFKKCPTCQAPVNIQYGGVALIPKYKYAGL